MAYQPAVNVVEVELRYTYFEEQVENTLHFHNPDGVTTSNMQDLADFIDEWWATAYRQLQSSAVIYRETYLTDLTTSTGPTYTSTANAGVQGLAGTSPGLPGNVTACVSFRTAARGRTGRGRNYFVGLTESMVNGNQVLGTQLNAIVTAYEELLPPLTAPYVWSVLSRYEDGVKRPTALARPVQNVLIVDQDVDSQRRRLAKRGR